VANETTRVVRFDSVGGAEVLKIQKRHGLQAAGRPTCLWIQAMRSPHVLALYVVERTVVLRTWSHGGRYQSFASLSAWRSRSDQRWAYGGQQPTRVQVTPHIEEPNIQNWKSLGRRCVVLLGTLGGCCPRKPRALTRPGSCTRTMMRTTG